MEYPYIDNPNAANLLLDDIETIKASVRRTVKAEIALLHDALAACDAIGTGGQHIGRAIRVSTDHMERVRESLSNLRMRMEDYDG